MDPVQSVADMVVDFLIGGFAQSMALIGQAVCGLMTMGGRLLWGAVLPEIPTPFFFRRRI